MIIVQILAALAALLWLTGFFYLWIFQEKHLFPENGAPFGTLPELMKLGAEALSAEREGQKLRWYRVAPQAKPRALVIVYHGNWDGAAERYDFAESLLPQGCLVILAEYPGWAGEPRHTASEALLTRNALALFDEVVSREAGLPIFLLGESLGTAIATFVAQHRGVDGLVLSTPYTAFRDVAKFRYPWMPMKKFMRHPLESRLWAPHVRCPVLVLHGTNDRTVPYFMGQRQAKNFKTLERFVTIEGAGHSDIRAFENGRFWKEITAFLQAHTGAGA